MPDATPTSTAPPSPPRRRNPWVLAGQLLLAGIVVYFIVASVHRQWADLRAHWNGAHPSWALVAASAAVVLATYLVLIETWRAIIRHWGGEIAFGEAARVWFASNLAKYIPGGVAQLGAIGVMARSERLSGVAASGAAVLNVLVNLATGIAIALLVGASALRRVNPNYEILAAALGGVFLVGLVLAPRLLPRVVAVAARLTGRELRLDRLPPRALVDSAIGNVVAWIGYGAALQLLVVALLGSRGGSLIDYVAAFAAAYVVGYLVLVMPGGLGARELTLVGVLPVLVPTISAVEAGFVAIVSRVIMTVLDLVPGFLYLAHSATLRRRQEKAPRDGHT
ncbi:MAG TPA: lysylphosphatidylglycerol synthase domain-containing protein [Gemmatimonadaceae bacterium]|nr:lysylphosphatidylglycerol synthase domain-containing protein [Gemmatimonadaceae bacterium]